MNGKYLLFLIIVVLILSCKNESKPTEEKLPNIIYIMADDLGYGDVSYQGQTKFKTTHIDALAASGMMLKQHYSGSPVCAPSRAVLMTGLHTGHVSIRGNKPHAGEGQFPMNDEDETIAEILKQKGYTTGAFGKWGLGSPGSEGDPMKQGFDEFYGYNCQSLAHNYYPRHLWHNNEKIILEENKDTLKGIYGPELIQEKTLAFLDQHKEEPFFLFVPHIMPHAELAAPESIIAKYRGKLGEETPYIGTDSGEKYRQGPYGSQEDPHAAFAAMVEVLDRHVGEIVNKVKELGLEDNTLIVFTSDNGPHREGGADPEYFESNGQYSGIKRDLKEGGIRVPTIYSWKGKIKEGSKTNHESTFQDVKATLAEIVGIADRKPDDGISFSPSLLGQEGQQKHEYLYWEFNEGDQKLAVRMGIYKGIKENLRDFPDQEFQLYNLDKDIAEENNIADQHPEILKKMEEIQAEAHVRNENFLMAIDGAVDR